MFTGIITGVGQIAEVRALGDDGAFGNQLRVQAPQGYLEDVGLGDSIALNGACMTVTALLPECSAFTVDVSAESLARTAALDQLGPVNLEKAVRPNDRLGGHMVSGHVDGIGQVVRFAPEGESWRLNVRVPTELGRYMAVKGSVTINGVSLTVNEVADQPEGCEIGVNLIPHTVTHTALHTLAVGARVNVEIDLIARYCERLLSQR